jgi:hypothetical protein
MQVKVTQDNNGSGPAAAEVHEICFGLDRATDENSLRVFIEKFANPVLLEQLMPRLSDSEIHTTVDSLTALLRRHLSRKEYHQLFLRDCPRNNSPESGKLP